MVSYRPGRRRRVNPMRLTIAIVIVAVVVVLLVFLLNNSFGNAASKNPQEDIKNATFDTKVKVAGLDLEGKTMQQAEQELIPIANQMLGTNSITFNVEDQNITYALEDVGAFVDMQKTLEEAIAFRQDKNLFTKAEDLPEKNYELILAVDESKLNDKVSTELKAWNKEAKDASFEVKKTSNEETRVTDGEIIVTEGESGYEVNAEEIKNTIKQQIETNSFAPFNVNVTPVEPTVKKEQLDKLEVIGDYTTTFDRTKAASDPDRVYNIWKISDSLNGVVIQPGESFSVNDHVGPRTEELGWKLANGIELGEYTLQAGGGICQVSTTLYNSALLAELKMVNRIPHTIPAAYVPLGLDATISTGGPDFKFENNTSDPVVIVVKCNGPEKKVRVLMYGNNPRDYKLKYFSEKVEEMPIPLPTFKVNKELSSGGYQLRLAGRIGQVAHVFKQKYDLEGNAIGDKVKATQATYKAIAPVVEIASDVPMPAEGTTYEDFVAQRQAAGAAAAAPPPEVEPAPPVSQTTPTPAPPAPPTPTPVVPTPVVPTPEVTPPVVPTPEATHVPTVAEGVV